MPVQHAVPHADVTMESHHRGLRKQRYDMSGQHYHGWTTESHENGPILLQEQQHCPGAACVKRQGDSVATESQIVHANKRSRMSRER